MANGSPDEVDDLLQRARQGEQPAFEELFSRYRQQLLQAIGMRLDRRLTARVDVADVLQDAYLEAARRLPEYLQRPQMPFYLWLRWITEDKILQCHRQHLHADKRAVSREVPPLPVESSAQFVRGMVGTGPSPSQAAAANELAERLRQALQDLDEDERDIILWRHFEQAEQSRHRPVPAHQRGRR